MPYHALELIPTALHSTPERPKVKCIQGKATHVALATNMPSSSFLVATEATPGEDLILFDYLRRLCKHAAEAVAAACTSRGPN